MTLSSACFEDIKKYYEHYVYLFQSQMRESWAREHRFKQCTSGTIHTLCDCWRIKYNSKWIRIKVQPMSITSNRVNHCIVWISCRFFAIQKEPLLCDMIFNYNQNKYWGKMRCVRVDWIGFDGLDAITICGKMMKAQ